jgi:hypothetical protein
MTLLSRFAAVSILSGMLTAFPAGAWQSAEVAKASIPQLVSFTGTLRAYDERPASGVVGITFLLYEDEEGGSPLWRETQNVTLDAAGHFSAMLGAGTPYGLPQELFADKRARWLAIEPEGLPTPARVMLLSVPYALKAGDAETIGGLPASAFLLAGAPSRTNSAGLQSSSSIASPETTGGSGTANYIPRWTPNSTTLGDSVLFQSGTGSAAKIGVNTTAPAATLDVNGSVMARGALKLPSKAAATAGKSSTSQPLTFQASAFNSSTEKAVGPKFQWQAEPQGNNTANPSGSLNLLYTTAATPSETGLSIGGNGQIKFAPGQTFPGTANGTVTGVAAGTGLTGGGSTGKVTLSVDPTKVPLLNVANTFTGDQTVTGNLQSTGTVSGSTVSAASGFNLGDDPFAFGSFESSSSFFGFAGNSAALASAGNNVGTGSKALVNVSTGSGNTANGSMALIRDSTGSFNSALGFGALYNTGSGTSNTGVGNNAFWANRTGSYNTAVGVNAGPPDLSYSALSNSTAIGANATVTASNSLVLGSINGVNGATASTSVGIGTTAPAATLDVHGNANFTGLVTFAAGQTFPGAGGGSGTLTGVTAGAGLTGGGTSGNVTLGIDATKVPQLATANSFMGDQTVTGNLSASGTVNGITVNATNGFNLGGDAFAFGSHSTSDSYLAFAGNAAASGNNNLGIGQTAMLNQAAGSGNTGAGVAALKLNSSGANNSALGYLALTDNTIGGGNTAVGNNALAINTTGSNNTALGVNAGPDPAHQALANSTAIGADAMVTANNSMVLGSISGINGATADTLVGIGTTAPAAKLDVHGSANFTGPITFASGQTFPGTISGVTAGTGLTGGGTSGAVTMNLDTTYSDGRYAKLAGNNTLTGIQVINNSVGIGLTPTYPLQVAGTIRSEGGLSLGGNAPVAVDANGIIGGRFTILANGKVGIDNPNPKVNLDVVGDFNASGVLYGGALSVAGTGIVNGTIITGGITTSGNAKLGSLQINGDTTMNAAPHMYLTGYVPGPLSGDTYTLPIFTILSKNILITRAAAYGVSTCPSSGALTFEIDYIPPGSQALSGAYNLNFATTNPVITDSGALSISIPAGAQLFGYIYAPNCGSFGTAPSSLTVSIEYVMQ